MKMENLVQKLNDASEAYYNGNPVMTDKEFDRLSEQLRELELREARVLDNSPLHKIGAEVSGELPRFKHTYPALSLDKTKDTCEFIQAFKKGIQQSGDINNTSITLMYKEDGGTVQAYYSQGKLDKLVTRGDGEVGSVVTHNANILEGLPLEISYKGDLVVRGEAVMSYLEFERINSFLDDDFKYKNPRNLASATITIPDNNEAKQRHLKLMAFNLVHIDTMDYYLDIHSSSRTYFLEKSFQDRLDFLEFLGFNVVDRIQTNINDLEYHIQELTDGVKEYPFPVDGLVAVLDNYAYTKDLKGTGHHPHIMNGYAFKWEDETKGTILREIEWSPSRTGLLNPVAIFDPVEIDGTSVQRASLHNLSIMRSMRLRVGNRITVYKANLIIPQIDQNLDHDTSEDYTDEEVKQMIGYCPTCLAAAHVHESPGGIELVYCDNPRCPEKMIGKFANFCSRECMDIRGMSEETIRKLVDADVIYEYADFFKLDQKPAISLLPGFGKQSYRKLCDAAERARNTDFVKFTTGMSIPNVGKGQAKTLLKYLSENYEELCGIAGYPLEKGEFWPFELISYLVDMKFDFSVIEGFGEKMSEGLTEWFLEHFKVGKETPETRVYALLNFTDELSSNEEIKSTITGKSFCITGKLLTFKNRKELVEKIESLGGRWIDFVSSKTDYLINNDTASTSGKNKKAKELNIPIISEQEFLNMLKS